MKNLAFLSLLLITLFASCEREGNGTTACIQEKIDELAVNAGNSDASVKEYRFQNQTVYVFNNGTQVMDGVEFVYDTGCNQLGFLGGLMGNSTINGQDFYNNAIYTRTIWTN
ncbi:MAG: DUF6970 domain-containing protein [Bacteroidia bacterium]